MSGGLRFLVIEGNPRERLEKLRAHGGRDGSQCHTEALKALSLDARVEIIYPADNEGLPAGFGLADFDGVVLGGSGLNIPGGDDDPRVRRQIELATAVLEAGVPFFGTCWGLQVVAAAMGGRVQASPFGGEMMFARKIALNDAGRAAPLFEGKSNVFDQPAIHVDEVTHLPAGGQCLAANAACAVQAAVIPCGKGTFWGVQYHPEFSLLDLAALIRRYAPKMVPQGWYRDEAAAEAHAVDLETLVESPSRPDMAWRLGLDADIIEAKERWREMGNWIRREVEPYRQKGS